MKKFLSWKVLFGFAFAITLILSAFILISVQRDRERMINILNTLNSSVERAEQTNQKLRANIDSLRSRVGFMASNIETLQAKKDSLIRPTISSAAKPNNKNSNTVLRRPVFSVIDQFGKPIGPDGIASDSLKTIKVSAGSGYTIVDMDASLARGTSSVIRIAGVRGNWTWGAMNSTAAPGDRILVNVNKVIRDDTKEEIKVGTVLLTIPLRVAKQPYYSINDLNTGEVISQNGIDHRQLKGIRVSAGRGYLVTVMDVSILRGTSAILTKRVKDSRFELGNMVPLQPGDKLVVDIKSVTLAGPSGWARNVEHETIMIPIK